MGRWILIGLIALIAIMLAYYLLRSPPAYDLDKFDGMVNRLRAGFGIARKVADIDAIPDTLKVDRNHVSKVQAILEAHSDDCAATVAALEQQFTAYQQELDALPKQLTAAKVEAMSSSQRRALAQKIVYLMAPPYQELQPVVEGWAWACKEESAVLGKILGSERM